MAQKKRGFPNGEAKKPITHMDKDVSTDVAVLPQVIAGSSLVSHRALVSPNGKWLLCIYGSHVRIYSCQNGDLVGTLEESSLSSNPVSSICFNAVAPHSQIYAVSTVGHIALFNYEAGLAVRTFDLTHPTLGIYSPYRGGGIYVLLRSAKDAPPNTSDVDTSCVLYHIPSLEIISGKIKKASIMRDVSSDCRKVAFDPQGAFVAVVNGNALCLYFFKNSQYKKHLMSGRTFTCVAIHPKERCIATGDSQGRILLWRCFEDHAKVTRSILHWHSTAVLDLAFSAEGSYLWSGGNESTLVQWSLAQLNQKDFLARMGGAITHLTISYDNNIIVVSHADNAMTLVGLQRNILCRISSLYWSQLSLAPGQSTTATGVRHILAFDPMNKCLVLRGKPGHLQLYDSQQDKLISSIDVVGQNIMSSGLNKFSNANIDAVAFADTWMCTADSLVTPHVGSNINLKFWQFDQSTNRYAMKTAVIDPHDHDPVRWISFGPHSAGGVVVTLSDINFKIWMSGVDRIVTGSRIVWTCTGVGRFQNAKPSACHFSPDGATLALAFGTLVTFWDLEGVRLRDVVLVNQPSSGSIRNIYYGPDKSDIFLVSTDKDISFWKLSTMTRTSTNDVSASVFVCDSSRELFVAASAGFVTVLDGLTGELVYSYTSSSLPEFVTGAVLPKKILADPATNPLKWYQKFHVYLLSANGELWSVDAKCAVTSSPFNLSATRGDTELSPYAHLKVTTSVDTSTKTSHTGLDRKDSYMDRISSVAAYTLPKPEYFLTEYLNGLIGVQHDSVRSVKKEEIAMIIDNGVATDDEEMPLVKQFDESPPEPPEDKNQGLYPDESFAYLTQSVRLLKTALPMKKNSSESVKSPYVSMSLFSQTLRGDVSG